MRRGRLRGLNGSTPGPCDPRNGRAHGEAGEVVYCGDQQSSLASRCTVLLAGYLRRFICAAAGTNGARPHAERRGAARHATRHGLARPAAARRNARHRTPDRYPARRGIAPHRPGTRRHKRAAAGHVAPPHITLCHCPLRHAAAPRITARHNTAHHRTPQHPLRVVGSRGELKWNTPPVLTLVGMLLQSSVFCCVLICVQGRAAQDGFHGPQSPKMGPRVPYSEADPKHESEIHDAPNSGRIGAPRLQSRCAAPSRPRAVLTCCCTQIRPQFPFLLQLWLGPLDGGDSGRGKLTFHGAVWAPSGQPNCALSSKATQYNTRAAL